MRVILHPSLLLQMPMGSAFAHVLNVPATEVVWPEDATELFFRKLFAMRLVGEDMIYRRRGSVWNHIRDEVLRLCDCDSLSPAERWVAEHQLHCYDYDGSFANVLFGDGSDDELGPDTLDSELLLTEVYYAPDACKQNSMGTSGPKCPVEAFPPTEQED